VQESLELNKAEGSSDAEKRGQTQMSVAALDSGELRLVDSGER
jgi:hypothetical protein